jgi:hypothetical protein
MDDLVPTNPPVDNFAIAASSSSSVINGEMVRFNKGLYPVGKGGAASSLAGAVLQVIDVGITWIKFLGEGYRPEYRSGWPVVPREELGDNDRSLWKINPNSGEPIDPWTLQSLVYLVNPEDGSEYTFVTSSNYGRPAVDRLAAQVAMRRRGSPNALPIVKLETAYKQHRQHGVVQAPLFQIIGWRGETRGNAPAPAIGSAPNGSSGGTVIDNTPRRDLRRELDDAVPF